MKGSPDRERELEGAEWLEPAPSEVEESYLELLPERPLRLGSLVRPWYVLGSGVESQILRKFGSC